MTFDTQETEPIELLVVEDREPEREKLRRALWTCPDFDVVADAAEGSEAVCLADSYRPEVVLLDLLIPGLRSVKSIRMIKENCPETSILALSHGSEELEAAARAAGADACLRTSASAGRLRKAILDLATRHRRHHTSN